MMGCRATKCGVSMTFTSDIKAAWNSYSAGEKTAILVALSWLAGVVVGGWLF